MTDDQGRVTTNRSADAESFGARLRRLREARGLTQAALAGGVLSPSYVSLLESDRRVPTQEALGALAANLGLTVAELVGEPDRELAGPVALAEAALGLGRSGEALEILEPYVDDLSVETCATRSLVFRVGLAYATALERVGRLQEAVGVLELLREAADESAEAMPWLPVTVSLVRCYRDAGDISRAVDVGEAARARLHGAVTVEHAGHVALVSTLSAAYAERGDLLRAQLLLEDLLDDAATGVSLEDQACVLWNSAITAVERGSAADGLRLADQAVQILALGTNLRGRARVMVAKAWVMLAQSPPQAREARAVLRDALPLLRQHAEILAVASAETELARAELLLNRPEIARRHATNALKRLGTDHDIERARALAALGAATWALGAPHDAADFLGEAATLLGGAQAPRQAAAVWRQLADVYRSYGDYERAMAAADKALDASGLTREPVVAPAPATSSSRSRSVNA